MQRSCYFLAEGWGGSSQIYYMYIHFVSLPNYSYFFYFCTASTHWFPSIQEYFCYLSFKTLLDRTGHGV